MSSSLNYKWPIEFPIDVPGEEVLPASGYVYRLVNQVPPRPNDFRMHHLDNPHFNYSSKNRHKGYGVSVWSKLDSLVRAKKRYSAPEQFGNKKIVGGELCHSLGAIPNIIANDGHVTLWKTVGAEPHLHICIEELL
ncbi:MAG: hypothetical protein ACJAYB_001252 [Psychromonas sp.]|jgi:hypothetical protein